ncbi:MAG TPA: ChaN family lipoprotein [Hyphomicrobiales bacterium]|nr:ChaN family lipoprotein [Hyphomicrobiales bacterium]
MTKLFTLLCCFALLLPMGCATLDAARESADGDTPPITAVNYRLFRGDGTQASWEELIAATKSATVTFLGEQHDDPVAHHLEQSILRDTLTPNLALSLEMFERDAQLPLDEYLAGQITEQHLIASGRAWSNYDPDYRLLIEFARDNHLPVLAANAPRRYVNLVSREGPQALQALSEAARHYLPPLPYADASTPYAEKFYQVMEENRRSSEATNAEDTATPATPEDAQKQAEEDQAKLQRSLQAQSLWDATMAHAIATFLEDNPAGRVLHVNGSFHSAQHLGIPEHLARYRPGASMLVITLVPDKLFPAFDHGALNGLGDFVIVTDPALQPVYQDE